MHAIFSQVIESSGRKFHNFESYSFVSYSFVNYRRKLYSIGVPAASKNNLRDWHLEKARERKTRSRPQINKCSPFPVSYVSTLWSQFDDERGTCKFLRLKILSGVLLCGHSQKDAFAQKRQAQDLAGIFFIWKLNRTCHLLNSNESINLA
jgi:hypothetical protein